MWSKATLSYVVSISLIWSWTNWSLTKFIYVYLSFISRPRKRGIQDPTLVPFRVYLIQPPLESISSGVELILFEFQDKQERLNTITYILIRFISRRKISRQNTIYRTLDLYNTIYRTIYRTLYRKTSHWRPRRPLPLSNQSRNSYQIICSIVVYQSILSLSVTKED